MISVKTADAVAETLLKEIGREHVLHLLNVLARVEGNRSFQESILLIRKRVMERAARS
jgi:hypothetical protein